MRLGANTDSGFKWFLSMEVLGLYRCCLSARLCKLGPCHPKSCLVGFFAFKIYPVAMNTLKCRPSAGKGCPCQHIWNKHSRCALASTQPARRGLLVCLRLLALVVGTDRERSSLPSDRACHQHAPAGTEHGRDRAAVG